MKKRFVKEVTPAGDTWYKTEQEIDGKWYYVPGSISIHKIEALKFYNHFGKDSQIKVIREDEI